MIIHKNPPMTLKAYKKEKLQMLDDFCIPITPEIKSEINNRTSEIDLDNYCRDLITKHLG